MKSETENKLRDFFTDSVVYKDLRNTAFFATLGCPSFMRDWLLGRFCSGEPSEDELNSIETFVKEHVPRREQWTAIKSRIIKDFERVKILAKISVNIDVSTGVVAFSLPDYGLTARETIIEDDEWHEFKDELVGGREVWGMLELGYRAPDDSCRPKKSGKIKLNRFMTFCPYEISLDAYREARRHFTVDEWYDVLLGAVDYNSDGYRTDDYSKETMLTRLLPFVEKRLNLIELAPKGTGKSYLYGRVSRFGWLSSGGVMSRAKMFYDIGKKEEGLVSGHDFIVLDEVQTISFADVDEMRAAMKGYMESGVFSVGNHQGQADAGVLLSGNISQKKMRDEGGGNKFEELPTVFHESALIDRFHGFIMGWKIPRMTNDLKICGWGLNSEYFTTIMHELRNDGAYRNVIDQVVKTTSEKADTRDTEAVKRLTTAFLKLFYPHIVSAEQVVDDKTNDLDQISSREFYRNCLEPARKMRMTILEQLGILDAEYSRRNMPEFTVER